MAGQRTLAIGLSLCAVFALQLWMCWGKLGLPFLDTRLHYNYDNADFLFRARSGNRNGDGRSQFGVTVNAYSKWGERAGPPSYNTDHPFLIKALFQQYTKVAGLDEWVSRSFYLAMTFGVAAGLYTLLLATTGQLLASFVGSAALVSLPVFAVYETCVKFETDGMLLSVWLFVSLVAYFKSGRTRSLAALGTLTILSFLTHWSAMLFVGTVWIWLVFAYLRRRDETARRALLVVSSASAAGALGLALLMSYLQHGPKNVLTILMAAFGIRAAPIPLGTWWTREWLYARLNFTDALLWSSLIAGAAIVVLRWHGRAARSFRAPDHVTFVLCALAVAVAWIVLFRQGSFIHVYWQLWFCLPLAVLVAELLRSVSDTVRGATAGAAIAFFVLAILTIASRKAYAEVLRDQLGTVGDIQFLESLRGDRFRRFSYVSIRPTGLDSWFQGQLFEYYTDRPIAVADSPSALQMGDKALVLRYVQRQEVAESVERWSGKTLANEKCGQRICAYDVVGSK